MVDSPKKCLASLVAYWSPFQTFSKSNATSYLSSQTTTMFPNLNLQNVTLCDDHEELLAWIRLQERVISWLHGIPDSEPCPASSFARSSKNSKRHHYSPYPARCEPPRPPSPIFSHNTQPESTLESDFPASASEAPIWHLEENMEYRATSLIEFKVADDLPDPEYNPLVKFIDRNHY